MASDSKGTLNRRLEMLKYLTDCEGSVTYNDIVNEFGITRRSVSEDLYFIETGLGCKIIRVYGRNGGVSVPEEIKARRITDKEIIVLRRIYTGLGQEEKEIIKVFLFKVVGLINLDAIHKITDE